MEKDDEIKGNGIQYDYGFRIYDARIGRFLSQDPLFKSFPWYTPYQFAGNTPIRAIDLDGLEEKIMIREMYKEYVLRVYTINVKQSERHPSYKADGTVAIINLDIDDEQSKKDLNSSVNRLKGESGRKILIQKALVNRKILSIDRLPKTEQYTLNKLTSNNVNQITVIEPFNVQFETDDSKIGTLSTEEKEYFAKAATIANGTGATIEITGISSGVPTRYEGTNKEGDVIKGELNTENNIILSNDRANSVKDILVKEFGVPESNILVKSPEVEIKSENNETNKKNQRAEIRINVPETYKK